MSMTKGRFFFFPRLTAEQKFKVRKNVVLQLIGGKSVDQINSCVPCSIRTIYRWISRFFLGCMENLRDRQRTRRPRPGTDRHVAWIRIVVVDQDPAQCPCECAWWTAQRGPSLGGEVRQRPERLPDAPEPAAAPAAAVRHPVRARCQAAVGSPRFPQDPSPCPEVGSPDRLRRRVRPSFAERVRAHLGHPWADPHRTGGQQPGGPALGQGAGRPCHGGGLPGVSGADR